MKAPPDSPALLPSEASGVLKIFVFLFASTGLLLGIASLAVVFGRAIGWQAVTDLRVHPISLTVNSLLSPAYLYTAWLLSRARRLGAYLALVVFVVSAIGALLAPGPGLLARLIAPALSLIGVLLCWRHLEPPEGGRTSRRSRFSN